MFELGLSTCGKTIGSKLFSACAANGIKYLEISVDDHDNIDPGKIVGEAREYGVGIRSYHLPFYPFEKIDPSSPEPGLRRASAEYHRLLISRAAQAGIGIFVVHASGEPISDADRKTHMECACESLALLAEHAGREGAVIAVEDLPRSCLGRDSGEINRLISADGRLRVCFDTNHLLTGETASEFVAAVGEKIITTHISDYDFLNERHWLPGEGATDWRELVSSLEKVGYGGAWIYEVGFKTPGSIVRGRDLECKDFLKNYNEIFTTGCPSPVGIPLPGLTGWN